jgi:hypothetical protein
MRSNGRSDAGLDRARHASSNLRHADDDLRDHPGVPGALHTTANDLRSGYQAALATNPDLTLATTLRPRGWARTCIHVFQM